VFIGSLSTPASLLASSTRVPPESKVCPFQVLNKGNCGMGREERTKGARVVQARPGSTGAYCNGAERAEASASAAAFAVTESPAASSLFGQHVFCGGIALSGGFL
jgi:hypothetical protein